MFLSGSAFVCFSMIGGTPGPDKYQPNRAGKSLAPESIQARNQLRDLCIEQVKTKKERDKRLCTHRRRRSCNIQCDNKMLLSLLCVCISGVPRGECGLYIYCSHSQWELCSETLFLQHYASCLMDKLIAFLCIKCESNVSIHILIYYVKHNIAPKRHFDLLFYSLITLGKSEHMLGANSFAECRKLRELCV